MYLLNWNISPGWTSAFLAILLQVSLSFALRLHSVTPILERSSSKSLLQYFLERSFFLSLFSGGGLPLILFFWPSPHLVALFSTYQSQLILLDLIKLTISSWPNRSSNFLVWPNTLRILRTYHSILLLSKILKNRLVYYFRELTSLHLRKLWFLIRHLYRLHFNRVLMKESILITFRCLSPAVIPLFISSAWLRCLFQLQGFKSII